jgi:integrase
MASIRAHARKSDGVETYSVLWRDVSGTQRSRTYDRREDAEDFVTLLDEARHNGTEAIRVERRLLDSGGLRLDDVAGRWLAEGGRAGGAVRRQNRKIYTQRIAPTFGRAFVADITEAQVRKWLADVRYNGKQPATSTLQNWHSVLSSILSAAVIEQPTIPVNVARGVRITPVVRDEEDEVEHEMIVLTRHEFDLILAELAERYRVVAETLVGSGLRFGELQALRVRDLRLRGAQPCLNVSKAMTRNPDGSGFVVGPTKGRQSRQVVIGQLLASRLREHGDGRDSGEVMFTGGALGAESGRLRHSAFYKAWKRAIDRAADAERHPAAEDRLTVSPRVHDLRHTYASRMLARGADVTTVSRQLGHRSTDITSRIYAHVGAEQLDRIAALADAEAAA